MLFGIRMEDFNRKAFLVAGGHMTNAPGTKTYSSVVTRETLHITLTMAALYYQEVKAADILSTYVMTPNHEKIWTVLDPQFGDDAGKSAVIVRSL